MDSARHVHGQEAQPKGADDGYPRKLPHFQIIIIQIYEEPSNKYAYRHNGGNQPAEQADYEPASSPQRQISQPETGYQVQKRSSTISRLKSTFYAGSFRKYPSGG